MACVVVRPENVEGVDAAAAEAFQAWLLTPAVQARIGRYVTPGASGHPWWLAGRHNANDMPDE